MLEVQSSKADSTYQHSYYLAHLARWQTYYRQRREKVRKFSRKEKLVQRKKKRVYNQTYILAHREQTKKTKHAYYLAHQEQVHEYNQIYRLTHHKQHRVANAKRNLDQRIVVFNHYGHHCVCCGETEPKFLAIDHVKGGGAKHRRAIGSSNIYPWLIKNKYPKGFQVLCHNCNMAKGFYGKCPHTAGVKT